MTRKTWIIKYELPDRWWVFVEKSYNAPDREIGRVQIPENVTGDELRAFADHLLKLKLESPS